MKEFLDWLWSFLIGGNIYPFNDDNSLPVYAGSILVSIAFAWRLFTPECAMTFSMILFACIFTTMICMELKPKVVKQKSQMIIAIMHNIILGVLIICACWIKLDLAIYTFGFIAILQLIIGIRENAVIACSIRKKDGTITPVEFKKSYIFLVRFCEIALPIIPALLIVIFIALIISFSISIKLKVLCMVGYFIITPIMSVYLDNYGVSVSDVVLGESE